MKTKILAMTIGLFGGLVMSQGAWAFTLIELLQVSPVGWTCSGNADKICCTKNPVPSTKTCNPIGGAFVSFIGVSPDGPANCTTNLGKIRTALIQKYSTSAFIKQGIDNACNNANKGKKPILDSLELRNCNYRGNQGTEVQMCVSCK